MHDLFGGGGVYIGNEELEWKNEEREKLEKGQSGEGERHKVKSESRSLETANQEKCAFPFSGITADTHREFSSRSLESGNINPGEDKCYVVQSLYP